MKKKNNIKVRIGLLIIILGLVTVLYPLTAMTYNDMMATHRMNEYKEFVGSMSKEDITEIMDKAGAYNNRANASTDDVVDPFEVKNYSAVNPLDYGEGEVFAYISIPKIDQYLPIYLGASQYHLSLGVGQLDGTDMPVGGKSTRSVLTGHRGGVNQLFFRHLDKMEVGDVITIDVFDKKLEYEVYGMDVIKPTDYEKLAVISNEDVITLLTCDPYVTATHRMIVNAKRIEHDKDVVSHEEPVVDEGIKNSNTNQMTPYNQTSDRVILEKRIIKGLMALIIVFLIVVLIKFLRTFNKGKNI